jgi:archaellum component FlaC
MEQHEVLTEIRVNVGRIAQQLTSIEKRLVDGEKRFDEMQTEINQLWDKYNGMYAEYNKFRGIIYAVSVLYAALVTYLNIFYKG